MKKKYFFRKDELLIFLKSLKMIIVTKKNL
jgi:hypothetical protein